MASLRPSGFTLVELMITIAILFILAAIAIPMYTGYIREGHFTTMRTDLDGLRIAMEDFRLENGTYTGVTADPSVASILADINNSAYTFTVSPGTNSYDVTGVLSPAVWVRCEDRMNQCCFSDTASATAPTAACP
jgi:type IV pilus assembly protein PilE